MANAYSISRTYNEFIPPVDLEFMASAMAAKQQRFDSNFAMLQQKINVGANLDLLKEEDRAYAAERLQILVNDINSFHRINLDSTAVATQLDNHLEQLFDGKVMNGVEGTMRYRGLMADIEKVKEKNPAQYSVINEMYALRPVNDWLYDGQVGTKMGNVAYIPYIDVDKKYREIVDKMNSVRGDEEFEFIDGTGRKITKTWRGLEPHEIDSVVRSMMSPEDQRQLGINGWYKYGLATPQEANAKITEYANQKSMEIDGQISEYERLLSGTKKPEERTILSNSIKSLTAQKQQINSLPESLQTPEQVGAFFETNNMVSGITDMYKRRLVKQKYGVDDYFFKSADLDLKNRVQLQKEKEAAEKANPARIITPADDIQIKDFELPKKLDEVHNTRVELTNSVNKAFDNYLKQIYGTSYREDANWKNDKGYSLISEFTDEADTLGAKVLVLQEGGFIGSGAGMLQPSDYQRWAELANDEAVIRKADEDLESGAYSALSSIDGIRRVARAAIEDTPILNWKNIKRLQKGGNAKVEAELQKDIIEYYIPVSLRGENLSREAEIDEVAKSMLANNITYGNIRGLSNKDKYASLRRLGDILGDNVSDIGTEDNPKIPSDGAISDYLSIWTKDPVSVLHYGGKAKTISDYNSKIGQKAYRDEFLTNEFNRRQSNRNFTMSADPNVHKEDYSKMLTLVQGHFIPNEKERLNITRVGENEFSIWQTPIEKVSASGTRTTQERKAILSADAILNKFGDEFTNEIINRAPVKYPRIPNIRLYSDSDEDKSMYLAKAPEISRYGISPQILTPDFYIKGIESAKFDERTTSVLKSVFGSSNPNISIDYVVPVSGMGAITTSYNHPTMGSYTLSSAEVDEDSYREYGGEIYASFPQLAMYRAFINIMNNKSLRDDFVSSISPQQQTR